MAPPSDINEVSAISSERIRMSVQSRFNPVSGMTPAMLASLLDDFHRGGFRIARLWDALRTRDDILTSVFSKRMDSIGSLRWEVLINEDRQGPPGEADRHQEILRAFYDDLEVTDTLNQDMAGGVSLLARHILLARFDKYSVAEWIWRPRAMRRRSYTSATFSTCPLWWFENHTGRLRYLPSDYAAEGVAMAPLGWLVASSPNLLMEAACVTWLYKTLPLRDWLIFSEKFGMPGLIGKTDAVAGSDEWEALKAAVAGFGQDWAAVVNRSAGIEPLSVGGAAATLPYPPLVDLMNRSLSALVRGADLSTISAGAGSGEGASLQGEEKDVIGAGDAMFVSEFLQRRVDRAVIQYELGASVEPLAYFQMTPKTPPNLEAEMRVDDFLIRAGVPLGKAGLRARYNRPTPRTTQDA